MKVILLEAIGKLGQIGDTVVVKPGYARNFLLPKKLAVRATPEAIEEVQKRRKKLLAEEKERLDVATARADAAVKTLSFQKNVIDDEGRLFGSVTVNEIIEQAAVHGTEILRQEIDLVSGQIKTVGTHKVAVKFHPEVSFEIEITVTAGAKEKSTEDIVAAAADDEDVQPEPIDAAEPKTEAE